MRGVSVPGTQGVTHEFDAYREPAHGDFVVYLEMLERRQLARLVRAQAMHSVTPSAALSHGGGKTPAGPSTAAELDRLMGHLESAKSKIGRFGTGQIVAAIVGAFLVLITLAGEGNVVTFVIGIVLLWSPVNRLLRLFRELDPRTDRTLIDNRFGKSKS
jgi:hypothetical protein